MEDPAFRKFKSSHYAPASAVFNIALCIHRCAYVLKINYEWDSKSRIKPENMWNRLRCSQSLRPIGIDHAWRTARRPWRRKVCDTWNRFPRLWSFVLFISIPGKYTNNVSAKPQKREMEQYYEKLNTTSPKPEKRRLFLSPQTNNNQNRRRILEWFKCKGKQHGRGQQTMINAALKQHIEGDDRRLEECSAE